MQYYIAGEAVWWHLESVDVEA